MINSKLHTTQKTGNYVRYFLFSVVLAAALLSCDKLDTTSGDPRDNLVGDWYCEESFGSQTQNYPVTIEKSLIDTTQILIYSFNLIDPKTSAFAKINGLNLSIPSQTVDGFQVSGTGTIASNYKTINLTYTVNTGSELEHWTAVYSR